MVCLSVKEDAINVAKGAAASVQGQAEGALNDARNLVPGDYDTRALYEQAKAAAVGVAAGYMSSYTSLLDSVNSIADTVNVLEASVMESVAEAELLVQTLTSATIAAVSAKDIVIPPLGPLDAAGLALQTAFNEMQCV